MQSGSRKPSGHNPARQQGSNFRSEEEEWQRSKSKVRRAKSFDRLFALCPLLFAPFTLPFAHPVIQRLDAQTIACEKQRPARLFALRSLLFPLCPLPFALCHSIPDGNGKHTFE